MPINLHKLKTDKRDWGYTPERWHM